MQYLVIQNIETMTDNAAFLGGFVCVAIIAIIFNVLARYAET